ncbi:MAG: efflux RND transporter permease subunit [Alphaproteobacteria bacterium]
MNLIQTSIERPVAVIAAVIMAVMFGWVALQQIPIQLAPDVNQPKIEVETNWFGAAPAEVEREIVNEQEDVLKGLEGLKTLESTSSNGRATVSLEFATGTDMDKALLLVANRLDRVGSYPDEADEPTLDTAGTDDNAIAWFVLRGSDGNQREIETYRDFVEDTVQEQLERVPGVGKINVFGGREREMRVVIDPEAMARYELSVSTLVGALRAANASVSGGDVDEGKRRYVVRTEGDFESLDQVRSVVLRSGREEATGRVARVTVDDIADVRWGYKDATARIRFMGEPVIAMNAVRETGANVIETMAGLKATVDQLNKSALPRERLTLTNVYDETVYIDSAIDLVRQNILYGGLLAALMLMLFLRSGRATLVVSLAIPVSVIASFVAMAALGRSINVISLAGLAFAVGMVVDAAIVVLENIYRLRQEGKSVARAAYEGASQVWGAILVSSLTTVLVFVPILTMQLEVGQLFRDIAVAISVAVLLSLLVAVTVIPALSSRLLGKDVKSAGEGVKLPGIDHFGRGFSASVVGWTQLVLRRRALGLMTVLAITVAALGLSWAFLPKLEYLPEGNRNFIFGIMLPPPGYNLTTSTDIAKGVEGAVRPYWTSETGPGPAEDGSPKFDRFFFVATNTNSFFGGASDEETRAGELIPLLQGPIFQEPGTFGFITQPSIFGRGVGGGRSINLDISGPELETILPVAQRAAGKLGEVMPRSEGHQFRPIPGLELGAPEVRVIPDYLRLADNGLSATELGLTIDTFNDGMRVAEITVGGKRLDLTLRGEEQTDQSTEAIEQLPVVTQSGTILPVSALADVRVTSGPTEVQHKERLRTITLEVRPSNELPLEAAMEVLNDQVIAVLEQEGVPTGVRMRLSGTADKLTETWNAMVLDLLLALIIVFLVMAVLFESFAYPFIIMLSVPVAAAGGIGGLALLNTWQYQPLDMLTMLGFVILIGIVVNNAILLVHQSLWHHREEGLPCNEAIAEATRNRVRPIFMSSLTSVFGMAPLVLFPGAGSELYRGLGSVVLGGLSLSAVLTLLVVPPLMGAMMPWLEARRSQRMTIEDDADTVSPSPVAAE